MNVILKFNLKKSFRLVFRPFIFHCSLTNGSPFIAHTWNAAEYWNWTGNFLLLLWCYCLFPVFCKADPYHLVLPVCLIWIRCHVYVRVQEVNDAQDNDAPFGKLQTNACGTGGCFAKHNRMGNQAPVLRLQNRILVFFLPSSPSLLHPRLRTRFHPHGPIFVPVCNIQYRKDCKSLMQANTFCKGNNNPSFCTIQKKSKNHISGKEAIRLQNPINLFCVCVFNFNLLIKIYTGQRSLTDNKRNCLHAIEIHSPH